MANPFGDPVAPEPSVNPFGDEPEEQPRGYVAASARAGLEDLKGVGYRVAQTFVPDPTKDVRAKLALDPGNVSLRKQLEELEKIHYTGPDRSAQATQARSEEIMGNLTPEAKALADKEYATTDPSKAAYLSPTRVAGDALRSIPTAVAMGASLALTRGRAGAAEAEALAAGATANAAKAAAMREGAKTMAVAGGASEGVVGGAQQYNSTLAEAQKTEETTLLQSPEYQRLLKAGWSPEDAREWLSRDAASKAGSGAAIVDAATSAVGGAVTGRIVGEAGGLLARTAKGTGTQALEEAVQSPLEQIAGNAAKISTVNPFGDPMEGVAEAAVSGGVVGGVTGGAMTGALGGKRKSTVTAEEKASTLDKLATATEMREMGIDPTKSDYEATVTKAPMAKPRLNATQSRIYSAAAAGGVDPATALIIAGVESNNDATAQNPVSSAHGIMQITDATWEGLGGGDRNDPALQLQHGITLLAQNTAAMERTLGRKPSATEVYLAHMFGPDLGGKFAKAEPSDPDGSFLDFVRRHSPKTAEAIVNGNGFAGKSLREVMSSIGGRLERKGRELGLDTEFNKLASATQPDMMPPDPLADAEAVMAEIDGTLAELSALPVTDAERRAAELEMEDELNANAPTQELDEIFTEDQEEIVAEAQASVRQAKAEPMLPRDLSGASPRYGNGTEQYDVRFADDTTKAAYIIANPVKRSERDAEYLGFVMQNTGMNEDEARKYGNEIRSRLKALAADLAKANRGKSPDEQIRTLDLSPVVRQSESGVSMDEARTRDKYPNPNDRLPIAKLPIVAGPADAIGKNVKEHLMSPGEVIALGIDDPIAPAPYMAAIQQVAQEMISKYAPRARVAISFQSGVGDAVASVARVGRFGRATSTSLRSGGLHHINMRTAKGLGITTDGSANSTTQTKITSSLFHEIGHVIADERMTEGMSDALVTRFRTMGLDDYFTAEEIASVSPEQGAVLAEYNALKNRVLNDPTLTIRDFVEQWLGPWKVGHGWGKGQGIQSFVKMFEGQRFAQQLDSPAKDYAQALHAATNILSPHEYMAEQMARYAYSTGLFERGSLFENFFRNTMVALRQFFQGLKRGGNVRPGVAFAEWVDSLTQTTKVAVERKIVVNKAVEAVAVPKKPRVKLADVPKRKGEQGAVKFDQLPPVVPAHAGLAQIDEMIPEAPIAAIDAAKMFMARNGTLQYMRNLNPTRYKELLALARNGQIDEWKFEVSQDLDVGDLRDFLFDKDSPSDQSYAEVAFTLVDKMPKRAGLRVWLPHAISRLAKAEGYFQTMTQKAFANPDVVGMQVIENYKGLLKAFKAKLMFVGLESVTAAGKLGKEQAGKMYRAMREEHLRDENLADLQMVNRTWRYVPSARLAEYATKNGLDEASVKAWLGLKNAHIAQLNMLQSVMQDKIVRKYKTKPVTQRVKIAEMAQMFQSIREKPFIPQTRFGRYALKVVEPAPDGGRHTVHVEFFETAAMRDEARGVLEKHLLEGQRVMLADFGNSVQILRTLPPKLLTTYGDAMGLTTEQKAELRDIADSVTKNPRLRKYSNQLAGITGANKNLDQNFADFFAHNANNIAKFAYAEHFDRGVEMIASDMEVANEENDTESFDRLRDLRDFAASYRDHILNPADEWQAVRALVVIKMLWGQLRTALMNLTSIYHLWALNASQQGLVGGTLGTGKAVLKVSHAGINNAMSMIRRAPLEGAQVMPPNMRWAMNKAKQEGLFDESFAAQLAAFSNVTVLRRLNLEGTEKGIRKVIWAGMQPQHLVEQFTRQVTLYAQFEMYQKQGLRKEESYAKAVHDTKRLQGDNTIANRPAFMRGKMALFTIFYSFVQNQLYLMSGMQERGRRLNEAMQSKEAESMTVEELRKKHYRIDPIRGETTKLWLGYLYMAGVMGLPGADDLDKVLELVAKSVFGERFSLKEYAYEMASGIAEEASRIGWDITPRSIVHGNLSDTNFFGLLPSVDVSGSAGLGQVTPGLGGVDKLGAGSGGDFLLAAMGPLGGYLRQLGAVFGDDPSMQKRFGAFMPNVATNAITTLDDWSQGVEYPNGGKVTVDMKTGEVRDLTTGEKLARLMGFQPSVITANKELHYMQEDMRKYWTAKRNGLVVMALEADKQGDREAIADAAKALDEFNASAPEGLGLTQRDLLKSRKRREKIADRTTNRRAQQRRFEKEYERLAESFGSED